MKKHFKTMGALLVLTGIITACSPNTPNTDSTSDTNTNETISSPNQQPQVEDSSSNNILPPAQSSSNFSLNESEISLYNQFKESKDISLLINVDNKSIAKLYIQAFIDADLETAYALSDNGSGLSFEEFSSQAQGNESSIPSTQEEIDSMLSKIDQGTFYSTTALDDTVYTGFISFRDALSNNYRFKMHSLDTANIGDLSQIIWFADVNPIQQQ
jgi:hypothetical protein